MSGLSAEERYRLLAAAVDRMPDTCDEECSSHGHSRACGEREAALPAAEIVRLSARVDALQQERDEYKELWREQAWRVDELDKRRDALAARVRELEDGLRNLPLCNNCWDGRERLLAALAPTQRDT